MARAPIMARPSISYSVPDGTPKYKLHCTTGNALALLVRTLASVALLRVVAVDAFVHPHRFVHSPTIRRHCPVLVDPDLLADSVALCASIPDKYRTDIDGNILVPERRRLRLIIFNGGTTPEDQDWVYKGGKKKKKKNVLWEMKLRNAKGISDEDMEKYNKLWPDPNVKGNTINDARRVIHNDEIHIAVCGNAGDVVAMYEFKSKKCVFWSKTVGKHPHDVEYIPENKGYLAVADSNGNKAKIELYDVSRKKKPYVKGGSVDHPGVHSVIWDAELKRLWGWGKGTKGLRAYKVRFNENGKPRLELDETYKVVLDEDIVLGVGHGGCPMISNDNDKRRLLVAAKGGILRFDTKSQKWEVYSTKYSNPKGLSHNTETHEVIVSRSKDTVYSVEDGVGNRSLDKSEIYKARWWEHNSFSSTLT